MANVELAGASSMEPHRVVAVEVKEEKEYAWDATMYRKLLVLELTKAERAHVDTLKAVQNLHKYFIRGLLTETQARVVFADFDELLAIAENFCKALEERVQEWHNNPRIGDLFLTFTHYLDAVNKYVTTSEESVKVVQEIQAKQGDVGKKIAVFIPTDGDAAGLNLEVSLVTPLTCITRFKTFLNEIQNQTNHDDVDADSLKQAQIAIDEVAKKISLAIKVSQGKSQMFKIANGFHPEVPNLISEDRYLEQRARVQVITKRNIRDLEMFIFNDMVLFATGTGGALPWNEEFRFKYLDDSVTLEDTPDGTKLDDELPEERYQMSIETEFGDLDAMEQLKGDPENQKQERDDLSLDNFRLKDKSSNLIIHCDSPDEKQKWMRAIRNPRDNMLLSKTEKYTTILRKKSGAADAGQSQTSKDV